MSEGFPVIGAAASKCPVGASTRQNPPPMQNPMMPTFPLHAGSGCQVIAGGDEVVDGGSLALLERLQGAHHAEQPIAGDTAPG